MDHPLDDCRLKIARAKQQFDALQDEIATYFKDKPYIATIGVDPQTGDQIFEAPEPPHFKRSWGVNLGEIAHNCRSALDWLVNVLVTESGGEPHDKTAFPISQTEDAYLRVVRRGGITYRDLLLCGLPDTLKERIDELQPYKRGDAWVNMPSTAFLIRCDTEVRNIRLRLPAEGGVDMQADFKGGGRSDAGLVFYPTVQVKREPGVEVVFGIEPDRMHGLDDIRDLILYVESIIESFSADLKPGIAGAQAGGGRSGWDAAPSAHHA